MERQQNTTFMLNLKRFFYTVKGVDKNNCAFKRAFTVNMELFSHLIS